MNFGNNFDNNFGNNFKNFICTLDLFIQIVYTNSIDKQYILKIGGYNMSIKEMREKTGLSQSKFAKILDIPTINISRWEQGVSKPPKYVEKLIEKELKHIGLL